MNILVTGGTGQVGRELALVHWPEGVALHMPGRHELDLANAPSVKAFFARHSFDAVINAGAYTAVDRAEGEVAAAFAANAAGPAILADLTRAMGVPLIHVSTDYVFDGEAKHPYQEDDPVGPVNVYGASKLAGELAVRAGNRRSVVLRTAWVLSAHGSNFLKTMLRLGSERSSLRVVEDQLGCPTSARDIAETLRTITLEMMAAPDASGGIYHFVNSGETNWAGLAREIFALNARAGGPSVAVEGISTADYPTQARRPANSRLSTAKLTRDYGIRPRAWQTALGEIMNELKQGHDA
ncbi:dTDP-4-dehydrorhamnose reductase [Caulobacter sp.]|uniref:dTDP-4-dehydrorhamnose reductase n=1 Tax=Caulobacter sp. TaxID=78 RepID=UPI003BA989A4